MVAHAAGQREAMLEAALAEVVEEDSTDAARLAAVAKKEILVAPAFVAGMIVGSERRERIAAAAVKVRRVLFEAVVGRQVHPATEPPYRPEIRGLRISGRDANARHPGQCDKQADVHVHRRRVGIARMQHQRDAHHFECPSGKLRPRGGRGSWELPASYVREIDSATLKHLPLFDDAGDSAAALPLPHVTAETGTVDSFEAGYDSRLKIDEIIAGPGALHGHLCRRRC